MLPYFVSHPGWRALGLVYLNPLASEYMHLLRAQFPDSDVFVAPFGGLKGCLARRFAAKKPNLIAILLLQGEVSHPFLGHGNFPSEKYWTANAR